MFMLTSLLLVLSTCPSILTFDINSAFQMPNVGDNAHLKGILNIKDCNRDFGISKESQHSIDDSSMSASSHELGFPPQNGRLFSQKAWMPAAHDRSQFLMIDLNEMMIIVKSATQGSGSVGVAGARVISYLLHYSIDGDTWSVILEKELPKLFMGNINSTSEVSYSYFSPVVTRFVKFVPYSWHGHIAMRVELYGCDTGLGSPLGMSSNKIEDSQIKASSVRHPLFKPSHGRLKLNTGGGAWCASPDLHDTKQYLLVTLKNPFIMTGVATQGMSDGKSWVKSYYLSYTVNQRNWFYYHDVSSKKFVERCCSRTNIKKASKCPVVLFQGNVDEDSVVLHHFSYFFLALEVRIHPQTWQHYICLRAELYGFSMWDAPFCHSKCYGEGKALCLKSPSKRFVETCICSSGHESSGGGCEDTDECSIGYDLCGAKEKCFNVPAGYLCQCGPGYKQDDKECKDVDECADKTAKCPYHTSCSNTEGSYTCDCNEPGFMGNGTHCIDINECETGNFECKEHSSCVNAGGSYMCFCDEGFTGDGKVSCTDINECITMPKVCGAHGTCRNTPGSYECICKEGFAAMGSECEDIDECEAEPSVCDKNALCINIPGSFACQCKLGFQNSDNTCQDVNECQENIAKCHSKADCYNTQGSYLCVCKENFYGDGIVCKRGAVECTEGDEDCEASEKVRKTRSSEPEKNNIQQLKPTQWFGAFVSVVTFRHIFMN